LIDLSGVLDFRIGKGDAAPGSVIIDPAVLNGLDAGSILIGGLRDKTATGFAITSEATSVTVDPKVSLQAPELILTAAPKTRIAQEGDSFDSVSGSYDGVEATDLAGSNPDAVLSEGQTLTIPKGDFPDYTTAKGETLASIAAANGVSISKLIEWNTQGHGCPRCQAKDSWTDLGADGRHGCFRVRFREGTRGSLLGQRRRGSLACQRLARYDPFTFRLPSQCDLGIRHSLCFPPCVRLHFPRAVEA